MKELIRSDSVKVAGKQCEIKYYERQGDVVPLHNIIEAEVLIDNVPAKTPTYSIRFDYAKDLSKNTTKEGVIDYALGFLAGTIHKDIEANII